MSRNIRDHSLDDGILSNFGGSIDNNLINILGNPEADGLTLFTNSPYVDTVDLTDVLSTSKGKFTVFSLKMPSKLIRILRITFCYKQLCGRCLVHMTPVVKAIIHCVFALL